jgi:hypothetical protein
MRDKRNVEDWEGYCGGLRGDVDEEDDWCLDNGNVSGYFIYLTYLDTREPLFVLKPVA